MIMHKRCRSHNGVRELCTQVVLTEHNRHLKCVVGITQLRIIPSISWTMASDPAGPDAHVRPKYTVTASVTLSVTLPSLVRFAQFPHYSIQYLFPFKILVILLAIPQSCR